MLSHFKILGVMFIVLWPGLAAAQVQPASTGSAPNIQHVEFFQAMKHGQLEVKFIPLSAESANVLIQNKTQQPLKIKLPETFAGVPVLAQLGGAIGGQNGGMASSSAQGLGGGMAGQGGGGRGQGGNNLFGGGGPMGNGFFNVAPEKTGKLTVPCVCLDHGKPDPTPRMAYKIVPAEEYIKRPEVIELMKVFGEGKISHAAVQAAAWNMNNDLSWQQLANKKIFSRQYVGGSIPFFQQKALQQAQRLALDSKEKAKKSTVESPGTQTASVDSQSAKLQPIAVTEQ